MTIAVLYNNSTSESMIASTSNSDNDHDSNRAAMVTVTDTT